MPEYWQELPDAWLHGFDGAPLVGTDKLHNYAPSDLIQIFGDVDVDSLAFRIKCENGKDHGRLEVEAFVPTGSEAVGLRIRRLVAIKINRVPIWREDPA